MKIFKNIIISLLVIIGFLYLLLPVGFGIYASVRLPSSVAYPPEGFETITLNTSDGVKLEAWYKPSNNGAAVILIHGATSSREGVRSYATLLADNGFGVLAIDLRGHGKSGGEANAFGWKSVLDVGAAVAYLSNQDTVESIGGLGISLGGEALLGAISAYPELRAVVSDGATHRSIEDYLILPSRQSLIRSWTTRVMYSSVRLFCGEKPPLTMLESISAAKENKLLLIAAEDEGDEVEYNNIFLEAAGERAELWVVPKVGHTGAYERYPEQYGSRIVNFFRSSLLNN